MDENLGLSSKRNNILFATDLPMLLNEHQVLQELRPLQSQVAGHSAANGKSSLGMLLHPDGYVLKPAEKKTQGENEIRFYKHLISAVDAVSQELQEYVPKFYGTRIITINGRDITCLALENVTEGMLEPCVMDVKIGKQTWEPNASEEKKNTEKEKYVESKRECGFCIPGMQFYDIASHKLIKYGKEYGKQLDRNGIKNALKLFLNWSSSMSHPIIEQFLCKLWKILKWFKSQRQFLFYSSSLLFVYDAHPLRSYSSSASAVLGAESHQESSSQSSQVCTVDDLFVRINACPLSGGGDGTEWNVWKSDCWKCCDKSQKKFSRESACDSKLADIKMIDFAHTLISSEFSIDSNYLEGLENLVTMFEVLLKESSVNDLKKVSSSHLQ
ncbi:inositol polyphosphate multikinase isoform X2 [Ischnura elegans]|nr:inositol polyphosphate multikinase isoform X2 [Ischnura elegans]